MLPQTEPASCSRCSKNDRLEEAEYCRHCLAEVIERRVGKKLDTLRDPKGRLITGKILIACADKNSLSCAAAAYLAKKLCKNNGLTARIKNAKAVIVPKCADDIATNFLEEFTNNANFCKSSKKKVNFSLPQKRKAGAVNIFGSITEKELELYASIKKIKYMKGKNKDLKQKIQKLQARYPGTIEALALSAMHISEIK